MRGLLVGVAVAAALSPDVVMAQPHPKPQPRPTITTARQAPSPVAAASPSGADVGMTIGGYVEIFNRIFDFFARIVELILFFVAVGLLVRRWKYIDWGRTGRGIIEKHSPVQLRSPQREAPSSPSEPIELGQLAAGPPPRLSTPAVKPDLLNVYQFGQVVFTADRPYEIVRDGFVFDKLLVKGRPDYSKPFLYAGREIMITRVEEYVGLLVSGNSVEGPVLRGVVCIVVRD